MVLVVIIAVVAARKSRKKKQHHSTSTTQLPPDQSNIAEPNMYSDTHTLLNSETVPSKYKVVSSSEEDDTWKANPVYMKVEEVEEYESVDRLTASKATHQLDVLEEEEEEDNRVD